MARVDSQEATLSADSFLLSQGLLSTCCSPCLEVFIWLESRREAPLVFISLLYNRVGIAACPCTLLDYKVHQGKKAHASPIHLIVPNEEYSMRHILNTFVKLFPSAQELQSQRLTKNQGYIKQQVGWERTLANCSHWVKGQALARWQVPSSSHEVPCPKAGHAPLLPNLQIIRVTKILDFKVISPYFQKCWH